MKLNAEIVKFIRESDLSYNKISSEVKKLFNVQLSKSLISYYKKSKNRGINPKFNNLTKEEREWLNGLFLADGCKFKEKNYSYTIKIALDKNNDKNILEKLIQTLDKLNCKFSTSVQKGSLVVKTFSKQLFKKLPTKDVLFMPKDNYAFLAGLIDGDGCKKGNSAVLVQYKNTETMNYLANNLDLKLKSFIINNNFGSFERREYYIPKKICDIIRQRFLSIKLCNYP